MNNDIANILKAQLTGLTFIDKLAGLVIPVEKTVNITPLEKVTYPVACDVNSIDCTQEQFKELIPDKKYRSIVYFEERSGSELIERQPHGQFRYRSTIRMVCWFNKNRFSNTSCDLRSLLIHNIIASMSYDYFNSVPYGKVRLTSVSTPEHTEEIFSAYTYNKDLSQYLFHPYDYFAIDFTVEFNLGLSCINDIELADPIC